MKGLKKLALVSAIAAVSAGAQAELKALDDSAMGELTGQKGLTIDVETKFDIGEFAYKDGGYVILEGISLGASENNAANNQLGSSTMLDNYRINIDVAGGDTNSTTGDNVLNHGNSDVGLLAGYHVSQGNSDAGILSAAMGTDDVTGLDFEGKQTYGDGDLLIHFTFTDAWQQGGGFDAFVNGDGTDGTNTGLGFDDITYTNARAMAIRSVDFNFSIDMIGIAASDYVVGSSSKAGAGSNPFGSTVNMVTGEYNGTNHATGIDSDDTTTALISGLSINGYLGIADLHIENKGNGFGADGSGIDHNGDGTIDTGTGNADSKIIWGSYVNVTDLDVYIDIAGVQLSDIKINNLRGDLSDINGNTALGFAHSIRTIYAVKDTVLHVASASAANSENVANYHDGVAINTRFKGDMDIGALSFGDTGKSIGEIYLTDIDSTTNWTISAH